MKKNVIDSSDHKITLENGHLSYKSILAYKEKLLPGPTKSLFKPTPMVRNFNQPLILARNRKLSLPKKVLVRTHLQAT